MYMYKNGFLVCVPFWGVRFKIEAYSKILHVQLLLIHKLLHQRPLDKVSQNRARYFEYPNR